MNEREELRRIVGNRWFDEDELVSAILAAGYHKGPRIPEPGAAEWEAMAERALRAFWKTPPLEGWAAPPLVCMDAALRAALGLDQPHRENDERRE